MRKRDKYYYKVIELKIDFTRRNKLKPDYLFYITNQIMKPVCQIYALIVENLDGYNYDKDYLKD